MMGASGNLMSAAYGFQAVNSVSTAYTTSRALSAQADYAGRMGEINARQAEFEAEDVVGRGDRAASRTKASAAQARGASRAALAAQGIDVNSGSALEVQDDITMVGELEASTIRNNAWRQAFGLKAEASNARAAGEFQKMAAGAEGRATLVAGGLNAVSSGMMAKHYYKKGTAAESAPRDTGFSRRYREAMEK